MTELLTESFCERCGTRYTFEVTRRRRVGSARIRALTRGIKTFIGSDDTSLGEAFAAARSDQDRALAAQQMDAFHRTFNFCFSCRQYTCANCWNETAGTCLSCTPVELPAERPATEADDGSRPAFAIHQTGLTPPTSATRPAAVVLPTPDGGAREPAPVELDVPVPAVEDGPPADVPAGPAPLLRPRLEAIAWPRTDLASRGDRSRERGAAGPTPPLPLVPVDAASEENGYLESPAARDDGIADLVAEAGPGASPAPESAPAAAAQPAQASEAAAAQASANGGEPTQAPAAAALARPVDSATAAEQRASEPASVSRVLPGRAKAQPAEELTADELLEIEIALAATPPTEAVTATPVETEPGAVAAAEAIGAAEPERPSVEPPAEPEAAAAQPHVAAAPESEPLAAPAPEPEPVASPAPEPEAAGAAAAPESEPLAAPAPESEPLAAPAPEPEPVAAPAPEPEAAGATATPEPEPAGAATTRPEAPAAPEAPAPLPPRDTATQPVWSVVAPDGTPAPTDALPPAWIPGGRPSPRPLDSMPTAWAARLANARPEDVWTISSQDVLAAAGQSGAAVHTIQPCVSCGLSLSASARFCRRCGARQQ